MIVIEEGDTVDVDSLVEEEASSTTCARSVLCCSRIGLLPDLGIVTIEERVMNQACVIAIACWWGCQFA